MRHVLAALLAMILLAAVPALAQSTHDQKFPNKDTAKNRTDNSFGTRGGAEAISIEENREQGVTIDATPRKTEEKDWYQNMIIGVDVNANPHVPHGPKKPDPD